MIAIPVLLVLAVVAIVLLTWVIVCLIHDVSDLRCRVWHLENTRSPKKVTSIDTRIQRVS